MACGENRINRQSIMNQLPLQKNIDVTSLSQIFKHTTNSYKYLFFQAVLSQLKQSHFKKDTFSFDELESEMLELAQYPINVFRLNFGTQDEVASKIDGKDISLIKYVPYRLLTPFYSQELKGLKDGVKNKTIERLSNQTNQAIPLYSIQDQKIKIPQAWLSYLTNHYAVIESWCFWNWVKYLQGKNPNALALVNKLRKPSVRSSLKRQADYWNVVLEHQPMSCIFSKKPLQRISISLDHFLPWSFIGHDQLWNLIPVECSVNSSKSDNIPDMNEYLEQFVQTQKIGLEITKQYQSKAKWENSVDDFAMGLNITLDELEAEPSNLLVDKYKETILPLASVAKNMGFVSNWKYKN